MSLKQQIQTDLKNALKEKNNEVASTLKLVLASIQNKEIELSKKEEGLSDEEVTKALRGEVKKRRDSIEAFDTAQRQDLKEKEEIELQILKKYLPPELSDEEIEKTVTDAITETNAESIEDFGKVMGLSMAKLKVQADGNKVSAIVKKVLNA